MSVYIVCIMCMHAFICILCVCIMCTCVYMSSKSKMILECTYVIISRRLTEMKWYVVYMGGHHFCHFNRTSVPQLKQALVLSVGWRNISESDVLMCNNLSISITPKHVLSCIFPNCHALYILMYKNTHQGIVLKMLYCK